MPALAESLTETILDERAERAETRRVQDVATLETGIARERRQGVPNASQASAIREAIFADAESGAFHRVDLSPMAHRHAERLLLYAESVALQTLDALSITEQQLLFSESADHLASMALFKVNTGPREQDVVNLRWQGGAPDS